ncbi:hypothetical protein R5W24_005352 [Gemmata sp. JC717]|uniref:hypothetical protein n=1 Tax=Gemmata algarum TaxID=2975278 RepID=UPI0021BA607E|nr:hypothetical protein [Gemmata algarum]MDY3556189.1 hypothetical protein [Gemmata algarum]
MPWTCQPETEGPLWWPLSRADHWYCSETEPERLAADFLGTHPEHRDRPLILKWWESWGAAEVQLRIEPDQIRGLELTTAL